MILNINNSKIEIRKYDKFIQKLKGLMFVRTPIHFGLCFKNCNAIHTFFMFQKIDVIMADKDNNIMYIYRNLKPFRLILPKKNVYYTYELPKDITRFYMVKQKLELTK